MEQRLGAVSAEGRTGIWVDGVVPFPTFVR